MSTATRKPQARPERSAARRAPRRGRVITTIVVVLVVLAAALSTKIVSNDSPTLAGPTAFDAKSYGEKNFPEIVKYVDDKAVEATKLATALQADPGAATQYGVASSSGVGAVVPVEFTGTVGPADQTGLPVVTVPGVPAGFVIHVQFGPAINGTDLRDATGKVTLNDFENQIQYQNAGAALNDQVKSQVLAKLQGQDLTGKTVAVKGVVTIINPQNWTVTPTSVEVQ